MTTQHVVHRVIEPGLDGSGMTPAEYAAMRADLDVSLLTGSQRYDIRAHGAIGGANDAGTFQAAIDAAHADGGGIVTGPAGTYTFTSGITLKDGVYLEFPGSGNTHLDFSGLTSPVSSSAIYGTGALTALPALASSITGNDRTVTFASAPDLAPGDVFVLYDSADFSYSAARYYYRAGEFARVESVAGTTVTLTAPVYAGYASGGTVSAYKVEPIRTGVSGARMTFTGGSYGIRALLGTKLRFDDLDLSGSDIGMLALGRCYDVNVRDVRAFDVQTEAGTNYGIYILNCQRVRITDVDLETRRHGLTLSGDANTGCVPNRDIRVSGGRISGMSTSAGVTGCNMHGNCGDVHFENVKMPAGFNPSGSTLTVRGCDIDSPSWGSAVSSMEMLRPNWTFEGNTFRATANHEGVRGLVYINVGANATLGKGVLRFINNTFHLGPYMWNNTLGAYALYVITTNDAAASDNILEVRGNVFTTTAAVGASTYAMRVRVDTGITAQGFAQVYVIDNVNPQDMLIAQTNFSTMRMHFTGQGNGAPAFLAGPGSTYRRLDGGAGTSFYVNESGTTTWVAK